MSTVDHDPRLSVRITREQQQVIQRTLPYGMQSRIFRILIEDLLKILQSPQRDAFLCAIINRDASLCELIAERGSKNAIPEPEETIPRDDR